MNRQEFDKLVEETMAATAKLLIAKGAEYAGDADRLLNFKRNAIKNHQTVLETWQTYWGKHIDSINTYMARVKARAIEIALKDEVARAAALNANGEEYQPRADRFEYHVNLVLSYAMKEIDAELSEPVEGRFHDNINYSILCIALLKEIREQGSLNQRTGEP